MSLTKLSDHEKQIIFHSMNAILRGRFLEGEFQTRLGIEPEELERVLVSFPNVDDTDDDAKAALAINNCLNEVCYGLSFSDRDWWQWFSVGRSEVQDVYRKWAVLRGWSRTGIT